MKILCFSDFHMATDRFVSNFSGEKVINKIIKYANDNCIDKVFLIGDIFELWQSKKRMNEAQRLSIIEKRYSSLLEKLKKFQWIAGNHDWYLNYKYKIPEKIRLFEDGLKILIIHGHQWDSLNNSKGKVIGKFFAGFWGGIEVMFPKTGKTYNWIMNKRMKLMKSAKLLSDKKYFQKAFKQKMNVVIFGHTHKMKVKRKRNMIVANAGSCTDGKGNAVLFDTLTRKMTMLNFIA